MAASLHFSKPKRRKLSNVRQEAISAFADDADDEGAAAAPAAPTAAAAAAASGPLQAPPADAAAARMAKERGADLAAAGQFSQALSGGGVGWMVVMPSLPPAVLVAHCSSYLHCVLAHGAHGAAWATASTQRLATHAAYLPYMLQSGMV